MSRILSKCVLQMVRDVDTLCFKKVVFFGDKFVTEVLKPPKRDFVMKTNVFAVCLSPLCHFPCVKSHAIRK